MTPAVPGRLASPARTTDRFRTMMSAFPSGVAVITAVDESGDPHGMTCTSLCSVSVTPPTLLVCLDERSGTLGALAAGGLFAVNLLHARGRTAAELFAGPVPDRFSRIGWEPSPLHGIPALTGHAHTVAECRVARSVPAADHTIVVGEVRNVLELPEAADPLMYGRRSYGRWTDAGGVTAL
ncbi:flavin reductase family protein [Streptomyces sp. TR06-5]|uniref:flavin reductase family protein n=1 Tax=unclassified Streptomyces TaxID=2593676 RepID=UPI0039A0D623